MSGREVHFHLQHCQQQKAKQRTNVLARLSRGHVSTIPTFHYFSRRKVNVFVLDRQPLNFTTSCLVCCLIGPGFKNYDELLEIFSLWERLHLSLTFSGMQNTSCHFFWVGKNGLKQPFSLPPPSSWHSSRHPTQNWAPAQFLGSPPKGRFIPLTGPEGKTTRSPRQSFS